VVLLAALSILPAAGQSSLQASGSRNVKSFGAVCDGSHDDTKAIQDALAANRSKTGTETGPVVKVIIPDNCVSGPLAIGSRQWVEFEEGATLHALRGAFPGETVPFFAVSGQHEVTIKGNHATLEMNRDEYTSGEWRAGVYIYQSKNVHIDGLKVSGAGGDGFTIKGAVPPENIELVDVAADRCTRNGISIISGRNITIMRATLTNTSQNGRGSGTKGPWAGLDVEPNGTGEVLENIVMDGLQTSFNAGPGLQFVIYGVPGPVTIRVSNLHSDHDGARDMGGGFYYGGIMFGTLGAQPATPLQGQILIEGSTIEHPNGSGVLWRNWSANEPKTVIRNMRIHNPGAQTGNMNRCGLYYNVRDSSFGNRYTPGTHLNVEVDGLVVRDDNNRLVRAVWFEGDAAHPLQATVNNVQEEGNPTPRVQVKLR
jgi:predicted secreted protein